MSAAKRARRATWAPAITQKGQSVFLFFGANDIQNNKQYGSIGIVVSDKLGGPYTDYLGKPLMDSFHNGAQPIDSLYLKTGMASTT